MSDFTLHIERIAQAHKRLDGQETRLTSLETRTAVAAEESRQIRADLSDIKGSLTWITRLVIGGILAGVVAFIISGGLNVGS